MSNITLDIGNEIAKIGEGLKESMDLFKKSDENRKIDEKYGMAP